MEIDYFTDIWAEVYLSWNLMNLDSLCVFHFYKDFIQ